MMNAFEKLLVDLSESHVEFILVGGLAVALCGYVRATEDVDILVRLSPGNIARLLGCLEGFGEGAASELSVDDFTLEEGSIRVVEDFPLDMFTLMSGHTYEDLLPLTEEHQLDEATFRYLSAEGLIKLKSASLRPRDQLDVQMLRSIQQGN